LVLNWLDRGIVWIACWHPIWRITLRAIRPTICDVLFERRSDIGKIELSCANTNIPALYIDFVNLNRQVFPWILPFDRWAEEASIYLQ
jgi:hypothetical protein